MPLLLVVFVHKDGLVGVVELLVKVKLLLTKLPNHSQQHCVVLHVGCELTLGLLELSFGLLDHLDAPFLGLSEPVLQIDDGSRRPAYLQIIKIDQVTKSKHLSFIVLTLSQFASFLILFDLSSLLVEVTLELSERLMQLHLFVIEYSLTINELQKLCPSKEN